MKTTVNRSERLNQQFKTSSISGQNGRKGEKMNTNTHKTPVLIAVTLLAVTALFLSACSFGRLDINPGSVTVDIALTEKMLNEGLPSHGWRGWYGVDLHDVIDGLKTTDDCEMTTLTGIELHDGFIRFVGTIDQANGPDAPAAIDLNLSAENGALKAEITSVDMPGLTLKSPCIAEANHDMAAAFTKMVVDVHGELLFKEVVVEEGVWRMKVQVNID
jgi:hypothetical protein